MLVFILFILSLSVSVINWLFPFSSSDALRESLLSMDSWSQDMMKRFAKQYCCYKKCISETNRDSSLAKENKKMKREKLWRARDTRAIENNAYETTHFHPGKRKQPAQGTAWCQEEGIALHALRTRLTALNPLETMVCSEFLPLPP